MSNFVDPNRAGEDKTAALESLYALEKEYFEQTKELADLPQNKKNILLGAVEDKVRAATAQMEESKLALQSRVAPLDLESDYHDEVVKNVLNLGQLNKFVFAAADSRSGFPIEMSSRVLESPVFLRRGICFASDKK